MQGFISMLKQVVHIVSKDVSYKISIGAKISASSWQQYCGISPFICFLNTEIIK
jgi:hypothetical protein